MNIKFRSVALTGKSGDERVFESIRLLAGHLVDRGLDVAVAKGLGGEPLPAPVTTIADAQIAARSDLMITVGGDGTMLRAARLAAAGHIPLLGINRGRLGFLADVSPNEMLERLEPVLAGEYRSEQRMLLAASITGDQGTASCGLALNDVVVKRQDTGRMLEFTTHVDGHYVNTHGGDGFIVATPTGSTAYALSCGGPIVAPGMDAIVLAPISPHTLSDRPLVIPGTSLTEVRLRPDDGDTAEVSCDGEVAGKLRCGDVLQISVASERLELIHPSGYDYYQILRNKLHWGRGTRGQPGND